MPVMTLVVKIDDLNDPAARKVWDELHDLAKYEEDKKPNIRVTAISSDNEMLRMELIEQCLERYDDSWDQLEAIRQILDWHDLETFTWDQLDEDE